MTACSGAIVAHWLTRSLKIKGSLLVLLCSATAAPATRRGREIAPATRESWKGADMGTSGSRGVSSSANKNYRRTTSCQCQQHTRRLAFRLLAKLATSLQFKIFTATGSQLVTHRGRSGLVKAVYRVSLDFSSGDWCNSEASTSNAS